MDARFEVSSVNRIVYTDGNNHMDISKFAFFSLALPFLMYFYTYITSFKPFDIEKISVTPS